MPYSFFEDQVRYDMSDELTACKKPKLFIFGNWDKAATPDRVKKIYDITAKPKELYELNSDHNYLHHKDLIDEVNMVIGNFLGKYENLVAV